MMAVERSTSVLAVVSSGSVAESQTLKQLRKKNISELSRAGSMKNVIDRLPQRTVKLTGSISESRFKAKEAASAIMLSIEMFIYSPPAELAVRPDCMEKL